MPGIYRLSIDNLLREIEEICKRGIRAILLFGVFPRPKPQNLMSKTEINPQAWAKEGIVQKAVRAIKREFPEMGVVTDVCLCGYTSHGHCGILKEVRLSVVGKEGRTPDTEHLLPPFEIDDDATVKILAKIALSHAESGADWVAPSAMMDGQVRAIRETLNNNEFEGVGILAYSAKYASNLYGPFREALDSTPQFGDRRSYQMDYRNSDEALREIKQDIDEGADIVMVKPALAYLDIIYRAKQEFNIPIAAYSVSGEYAMVKAYARLSSVEGKEEQVPNTYHPTSIPEKELVSEILTAIKRAGADLIITYWAKDVAKWL